MSHWLDERYRHETVIVRTLWVTIALSLLVHLAALFLWLPRIPLLTPRGEEQELANDRLQARLAAIPKPAPVRPPEPSNEIVASARPPALPLSAIPAPTRPSPAAGSTPAHHT